MSDLFGDIVYAYTWDDAIRDGVFIDVSGIAKTWGFNLPVAVTSNIAHRLCEDHEDVICESLLGVLIGLTRKAINEMEDPDRNNMVFFKVAGEDCMAVIEARSPQNPEPIMTIMLMEDR